MRAVNLIVIGTSAGGVSALQKIFRVLPRNFSLPVVVTQHIAATARIEPQMIFGQAANLIFEEARDKTELRAGHVYFAPADYHVLLEKDRTLSVSQDDPVHFARPSIDVCFASAAHSVGAGVCGILLTGANNDGAAGLKAIADAGGFTIVQKPEEAEFSTMPKAALDIFEPSAVLGLADISQQMIYFSEKGAL